MLNTWHEHNEFGTFPNGGAYDDQPIRLLEDWSTLDRRLGDLMKQLKDNEDYLPPTLQDVDFEAAEQPKPTRSLHDLIR